MTVSNLAKITFEDRKSRFGLKLVNDGATGSWYPLDLDIWVRTGTITPGKVVTWLKLEVAAKTPLDLDGVAATSVKGRLHDGTSQYWWNGSGWTVVVSTSTSWNTLQELSDNIGSWTHAGLGIVLNLATTDRTLTPTVSGIKVLYTVRIGSFKEDWVYDTLVAQLASQIRPSTDYILSSDGGDQIATALAGWTIADVNAVWNHTADPDHLVDLLDSFDSTTGVVTLTAPIEAGAKVFISARYVPVVAVNTSPDFQEQAASPAITITNIQLNDLGEAGSADYVMDRFTTPPTAAILPAPRRYHLDFTIQVDAPLAIDLDRITEEVSAFVHNNQVLVSGATGLKTTLRMVQDFNSSTEPTFEETHTANMAIRMENVYMWHKPIVLSGDPDYPGMGYGVQAVSVIAQVGNATETTSI